MSRPAVRIAVTGGIAEGKSTVLGYFRDIGLSTASADEAARSALEFPEVQAQVVHALDLEPPLDRAVLRRRLADSADARRTLNEILHPVVWATLYGGGAAVIEVPLLIETCLQDAFERVLVVTCGPEEQLRRLTARLGDEVVARALIGSQLPTRAKLPFADRIVRTDRDAPSVQRDVTEFARTLVSA